MSLWGPFKTWEWLPSAKFRGFVGTMGAAWGTYGWYGAYHYDAQDGCWWVSVDMIWNWHIWGVMRRAVVSVGIKVFLGASAQGSVWAPTAHIATQAGSHCHEYMQLVLLPKATSRQTVVLWNNASAVFLVWCVMGCASVVTVGDIQKMRRRAVTVQQGHQTFVQYVGLFQRARESTSNLFVCHGVFFAWEQLLAVSDYIMQFILPASETLRTSKRGGEVYWAETQYPVCICEILNQFLSSLEGGHHQQPITDL